MRSRCLVPVLAFVAATALPAAAATPTYVVVLTYHVTNTGSTPIEQAVAACRLPVTNRYQTIVDSAIHPEPTASQDDTLGQKIAVVDLGPMAAGEAKAVHMICWVRPNSVQMSLTESSSAPSLTETEKAVYLRDEPILGLDKVRVEAKRITASQRTPMQKARAVFQTICKEYRYDIDETVEPAPKVVASKEGSCSELTFAFVAMCRAVDVPARIVSGFRNREGQTPSSDWRTHRWAEFFVDNVGWIPADPTNQIHAQPDQSFFGRQIAEFVAVIEPPDDSPRLPPWEPMQVFYRPARSDVTTTRHSVWRVSQVAAQERAFFDEACKVLRDPAPAPRVAALDTWERRGELLRGAFALEAMYDLNADVRRAAARALGTAGDPTVTLPLLKFAEKEANADVKAAMLKSAEQLLRDRAEHQRAVALANVLNARTDDSIHLAGLLAKDQSREIRERLAGGLYKCGDKPEVHAIYQRYLDEPDEALRFYAIQHWCRAGSWTAAEKLVDYLNDRDEGWRRLALTELRSRAGTDFGFNPGRRPNDRANVEARQRWEQWVQRREARPVNAKAPAAKASDATP